ncbi:MULTISPECIES: phosphatase PAP2 family protein [unclassified Ensifer]|uniref:phosphatase PAP2 family protein n=1 Tax=unclassified Ensifer TaxID=2633371 RepID=UPI0008130BD9|nr:MULTISPECIES: phosphatase PAP2 family protein [unclassified Ensifer]OCO99753.1 phosphatidic acid phosphatase [Ensifer sp. LC14]OCP02272.1 phosphatidic acid phosphatase [Ensifer sp. LC11]OCP02512.1 phosphatidic acid phosphatase [Ensifer sp. LC13]OCP29806.1 phosphatidic acid phosphatase [Ensifer sp. LC499]
MNRPLAATGWIVLTTLILVFALIPLDPFLSQRAQGLPDSIIDFNEMITDFGTFGWMIYLSGGVLAVAFVLRRAASQAPLQRKARTARDLAAYFLLTIGTASALVHTLKFLFGRARPELFAELGAYSLTPFATTDLYESFPSGHSTAAGAFFGVFAMLLPKLRPLFLVLALTIGVSRVVVGAHYPSDVAAGLLLGLWSAVMTAFLFAKYGRLFDLGPGGWPLVERGGPRE